MKLTLLFLVLYQINKNGVTHPVIITVRATQVANGFLKPLARQSKHADCRTGENYTDA